MNNEFKITDAKRQAAPVTCAFIGQSGSGKTYSALLFTRGLVGKNGKIVVIDTEGRRSLIYADDPEIEGFQHLNFEMPYSTDRFKEAVMASVMSGADAIIIDSVSHSYEGEGGLLDFAEKEEARLRKVGTGRGAHISKWIRPKMSNNRFTRCAVGAPAHIIFCIREKVVADMSEEAKKKKPEDKIMYVPVCEKNLIFEMTIAVRLEPDTHKARFIKVPKPFEAHIKNGEVITVEHGRKLLEVANTGDELDKEYQKQLTVCKDVAAYGTDSLKEHWSALPPKVQAQLKEQLDTVIKPIAVQADSNNKLVSQSVEGDDSDK